MEFAPLDFFPTFNRPEVDFEEMEPELELAKNDVEDSGSTVNEEDSVSASETNSSSKKSLKSSSSENHNMVKQLIITIKQMTGKFVKEVGCSFNSRQIIKETWRVFEKTKNPSKQILKAMFNKQANKKLIEKVGLGPIFTKFGSYEYLNAMDELRMDLVFKMRSESLKTHMFQRNIQKKERLVAYIQYFIEEELKNGRISSRFSESAGKRMNEILENNKNQAECIDCYFQDMNEAFERFAS